MESVRAFKPVFLSIYQLPIQAKERVLFVFNKPLLADGGPYEVEFKGGSHCLRVPAVLINSCTLQAHAPGKRGLSAADPVLLLIC